MAYTMLSLLFIPPEQNNRCTHNVLNAGMGLNKRVNDLTWHYHRIIMQMVTMIITCSYGERNTLTHSPGSAVRHSVLPQPKSCERYRRPGNVPECKQSSPNRENMHVNIWRATQPVPLLVMQQSHIKPFIFITSGWRDLLNTTVIVMELV